MAWEGVLYAEYSTRNEVSKTIQHSACLVLYCSLDPAPRAIFCIQHSLPCYNYYILLEEVALGKHWVDNQLEDGNEDKDEDGIEGLNLVGLDGNITQSTIHSHCLEGPT